MKAIHAVNTETGPHVVGVRNLRVMLVPNGEYWFAQGMEIDYAAQGRTLEEAQANFARGLRLTICEHLSRYHSIDRLVTPVPTDVMIDLFSEAAAHGFRFSQFSRHELEDLDQLRNRFTGIEYIKAAA